MDITKDIEDINQYYLPVASNNIITTSDKIRLGNEVIFFDYLNSYNNYSDDNIEVPNLRKGNIATPPEYQINKDRSIVIDGNAFKGTSGSPVFSIIGDEYKLVGVMARAEGRDYKVTDNGDTKKITIYSYLSQAIIGYEVEKLIDDVVRDIIFCEDEDEE